MEENTTQPQQPETSFRDEFLGGRSSKDSSGTKVVIGVLVLLIVAGIIGGVIFLRGRTQGNQEVSPQPTALPTPFPTPSPSPSPLASPEPRTILKEYKIQVLNGSGVAGAAGKVVALLEKEGASGIEAANASSYNYETTEVSLKTGLPTTLFNSIKGILSGYSVVKGKDLAATSKFDVVIIVGAK